MLILLSSLMATPETSSAEGLDEDISSRGEAKWKRFHPFRVVRKIFRRRIKREGTSVSDASKKSWSTSELQSVQDGSTGKRDVTSPLKIGLSVSHDSIFSPETSTTAVSNETLSIAHGSSLSVHHKAIKNMFKDELFTRVRARRDSDEEEEDDDDDDVGLPSSPCTSPTTVDVLTQGLKEKSPKPQTGSLISMESSENDEDSACQSSGHSSRMSLIERRSLDSDGDTDPSQPVPLNHNAAHHKISVRPKRTYGLPRRRMNQIAASKISTLPSTPEVTEESGKSFHELEVIKTFSEFTSSLNEFSSSKQSSEWKVCQMTSSFSYSEVSDLAREVVSQLEKSSTSENQIYKENLQILNERDIKPNIDTIISEVQRSPSCSLKDAEFSNREETNCFSDGHEMNDKELENSLRNDPKISEVNETSLKVSSLVRDVEKSEKLLESNEAHKCETKVSDAENKEAFKSDLMKEGPVIHLDKTSFSSTEEKSEIKTQQEFVKEVSQLDIDSEFILKTAKRDDKGNLLISSLCFEEESLMSSKSLSMGVEESGISVSHHASFRDGIKDSVVTEARNFAAVEENAGRFIQKTGDIPKGNDSWVSSLDIPTSLSGNSDVTVSSSTSTVCTNKITDEKITISVNANPDSITTLPLELKEVNQSLLKSENPELSFQQDIDERPSLKDKHPTKPQLMEPNSMTNAQKRVSVEIVPFSQRMKERKYQPISFGNKNQPPDQNKKSSTSSIERKLSDRRVHSKHKELDKPINRHSFSGPLLSDNKKTETIVEKRDSKTDKMQYPVQIRIHKSIPKPEIEDEVNSTKGQKNSMNKSISNEEKSQGSKIIPNSTNVLNEDKNIQDAKWEVKIQPSVSHNNNNINQSHTVDNEGISVNEDEIQDSAIKSNENSKKTSKETPLSDDPEPELLRVFARRSIKQKHCDKNKKEDPLLDHAEKSEEKNKISISDNSTVIKILEISKPHDLKKKSKSFCEKLTPPFKEVILKDSIETIHPRQRLASVPDLPLNLPPESSKESDEEIPPREVVNEKSPSWLQLAQQRRELREQRERLLLGRSPNSFMDASNKPSRSSKVWDMVNNFQKLQMT